MQNKAKVNIGKMNVSVAAIKDYDKNNEQSTTNVIQNKAKQSQIKPISKNRSLPASGGAGEKNGTFLIVRPTSIYRTMQKSRAQIYDELLVIKCRQGDREAFDELVGRWQKRLWHYAYRVTGSESTAWDVVQETWFAIIKGLSKLKDAACFPRWAFRILHNKCADWLSKQRQQQRLNNELTKLTKNDSDKKQNSDEKTESLWAAIAKLSPDRRALLTLRYHEGFDINQIAEITGLPQGTVKSRLHRTLDQLRQIIGRYQNG